jgi:hypothetical protein
MTLNYLNWGRCRAAYQKIIDQYGYGDQACESIVQTDHGGITIQLCRAERVQFNPDTGNSIQCGRIQSKNQGHNCSGESGRRPN